MSPTPPAPSRLAGALSSLRSLDASGGRAADGRPRPATPPPGEAELTAEQAQAVGSGARLMKVQAFAGAGKTTMLRAFAERSREAQGLYLAFNQSIAKKARESFPQSVRCQTHNAMALRALGARDAAWRGLPTGKLDQIQARHIATLPGAAAHNLDLALATLSRFIQSPDPELDERHVAAQEAQFLGLPPAELDPRQATKFARRCWQSMCDPASELPMPHDGYLKLWSIRPAQLGCDFVLIDEAQDSNPAFLAGMAQQRCRQIYVGDEHQGIYGFRGAVNALSALTGHESRSLTLTHRFGPRLCDLANAIVSHKGSSLRMRPSPASPASQVVFGRAPLGLSPLYLARTNAGLFEEAFALARAGKGFRLMGGESKLGFPDLADLVALASGSPAGRYAAYRDIDELEDAASAAGLADLALRAKLARSHGSQLPSMLEAINARLLGPEAAGSPTLSTLHQAKGLEADWVEILGDFAFAPAGAPASDAAPMSSAQSEECNVLYVALTRAKTGLAIRSPDVSKWARTVAETEIRSPEPEQDLFGS